MSQNIDEASGRVVLQPWPLSTGLSSSRDDLIPLPHQDQGPSAMHLGEDTTPELHINDFKFTWTCEAHLDHMVIQAGYDCLLSLIR